MSTSTALGIAINEAAPNPTGACNACQRTGLPILPLRAAYAPTRFAMHKKTPVSGSRPASIPMILDQPRILRQGYLYVLLDQKEWQAYQVTPEGALRQFRPYQVPREQPRSLSPSCIAQDHDFSASFINIDADTYSTAWIAFANDPWPESVLDQYRRGTADDGTALDGRFHKLDLKAARDNPSSVGTVMTEQHLEITQVLEYSEANPGDFVSVHGFYSRHHRGGLFLRHVRNLVQRENLQEGGVLAVVLPDPIGRVQECNAQRVSGVRALQEWRAEPKRRFEFFTSQALLGIKELRDAWAVAEASEEAKALDEHHRRWNNSAAGLRAPLPPIDVEAETQRGTRLKQTEARERLEERYDEAQRASFERAYLAEQKVWQQAIDREGELYAREYQAAPFQLAARYDYSVTSTRSVEGFIRMMSLCLVGGPSEVIHPDTETLGATQRLWKNLLEDRQSLLYQALLAKDQALFDQLKRALAGDDLGKLYDTLKSIIATHEGKELMIAPVKHAIGQILAATTNASNALMQQLSAQTQTLIGHVHSAAFLRYAGQQVTQVVVSLRLGEYLSLLNEAMQERTDQFITQLDQKFRKPAERKIRAMVVSGAIAIAVSGNHGKLVDVMLWSLESAQDLQARLEKLRANASTNVTEALRSVSIGAATLHSGSTRVMHTLAIGVDDAQALARGAMQRMRNTAISAAPAGADLLLGLGSLWFQQDSLRKNFETFLNTPGSCNPEALAAVWSSSIGVMGVGVEIAGVGTQLLRPGLTTTVRVAGQVQTVMMGVRIAQYGGAIAAVAGVMDGVQYTLAERRVSKQGDSISADRYNTAKLLSFGAAGLGVIGALAVQAVFLGPLGIALVLSLAAYGIAMMAKKAESSSLELWARHSRWGLPSQYRRWVTEQNVDDSVGALNAAILGMTAELEITTGFDTNSDMPYEPAVIVISDGSSVPAANFLEYRIVLPGYLSQTSRYQWLLKVYRSGQVNCQIIASSNNDSPPAAPPSVDLKKLDYNPKTTTPNISYSPTSKALIIQGKIALHTSHEITAMDLEVSFWPDNSDEVGCARLLTKEDKLDDIGNRH